MKRLFLLLLVLSCFLVVSCEAVLNALFRDEIEYHVTSSLSSATFNVMYDDANGNRVFVNNNIGSFKKSFNLEKKDESYTYAAYVSAYFTTANPSDTTLTATIKVNGVERKSNVTASGVTTVTTTATVTHY